MSLNIFAWIREGVRQSVLAGVSDAIGQMGVAVDGDDLRPRLAEVLRRQAGSATDPGLVTEPRPRRLGRSLKDIDLDKGK
jgi:hypothetical protein